MREQFSTTIETGSQSDLNAAHHFGGVQFQQFSTPLLPNENFNNHSIVTVINYAGTKVVLPGDNECASLELLMKRQDFKDAVRNADILLAPHHGRESAYHNEFVSHVNPNITIVSDGSICDTSANSRYSQKSRGWTVVNKYGNGTKRYCLTTNSDGEIYVSFGFDVNGRPFLGIRTY